MHWIINALISAANATVIYRATKSLIISFWLLSSLIHFSKFYQEIIDYTNPSFALARQIAADGVASSNAKADDTHDFSCYQQLARLGRRVLRPVHPQQSVVGRQVVRQPLVVQRALQALVVEQAEVDLLARVQRQAQGRNHLLGQVLNPPVVVGVADLELLDRAVVPAHPLLELPDRAPYGRVRAAVAAEGALMLSLSRSTSELSRSSLGGAAVRALAGALIGLQIVEMTHVLG